MKDSLPLILLTLVLTLHGLSVSGCAGLRHGYTQSSYEGLVLRTDADAGQRRLQIEMDYDAVIRNWVAQARPDYIRVKSGSEVELFYIEDRRTVRFKRGFLPESTASIEENIARDISAFFTRADQKRLQDVAASTGPGPSAEGR